MKKLFTLLLIFSGCSSSAIDQLDAVKKPCIVFSVHKEKGWWDATQMTVKDASGNLIELDQSGLKQLVDKYQVGDTIK